MAREIGWSQESNLLYQIKQLLSRASGGGSSTPTVQTYATYSAFPAVGTAGVFYVNADLGAQYVWDGSRYVVLQQVAATSIPTVTTNGVNKQSYVFTYMPASTYLGIIYYLPYINKTYPETNVGLLALNQPLPSYNSPADPTVTTFTLRGVNLINNATAPSFGSSILYASYIDLKYLPAGLTMPSSSTLTSVYFSDLVFIGPSTFSTTAGAGVTALGFPSLEAIQGGFTNNNLSQSSLWFPELLHIGSFNDSVNSAMASYSFPKLKIITSSFTLTGTKSNLTSISFGALEVLAANFTMPTTSTSLTSFSFANTLKLFGSNFVTTSNSLNQTSVDNILIRLAALDGTNGTVTYSVRTVTITGGAATPSAAGLTAKATLQARGCTVTTN